MPVLVPLGDEIWENGTRKGRHHWHLWFWELDNIPPGSSVSHPTHIFNNAGGCVPSLGKTEINKRCS